MENETISILLVEDDEDDHLLTQELLFNAFGVGHQLEWIQSYEQAITAIRNNHYDVYLLDRHLGPHDGLELMRELTKIKGSKAPAILLTGRDDRETDLAAMQAGATDYLVKQQLSTPLIERAIRYAIERKKVEQRLLHLAHYDPLTGLANRTLFQVRLQDNIAQAKRAHQVLAVLLLDLDNFKEVNDTYGHPVGDALLRQVADRLNMEMRESDTVSRLGGDEFVVIATQFQDKQTSASFAYRLIRKLAQPCKVDDTVFTPSTSLGIALYPSDGDSPEELLKHADLALYQAKNEGRNTYRFYDAELDALAQANKAIKADIEIGIPKHEFCLFYQPVVSTVNHQVVGVESLVRWRHPVRGWVQPDQFIPLAESCGLIIPLGEEILRMASRQIQQWQETGFFHGRVAVNISPMQLRDDRLIELIEEIGINPEYLEFEVTENVLIETKNLEIERLRRINDMGIKISIDDFGTGYSSLGYLKQLPIQKLKIDRSFVNNIASSSDDAAIVRAVIMLAHALNLEVVAEGVENEKQITFLCQEGCDLAQGYLIARPMPATEFNQWYRQHRPS